MEAESQNQLRTKPLSFDKISRETLRVGLQGFWKITQKLPSPLEVEEQLKSNPHVLRLVFDTRDLQAWDSSLVNFLLNTIQICGDYNVEIDQSGLPKGVHRLIALASAVPEKKEARRGSAAESWMARIGSAALDARREFTEILTFMGEASVGFCRLLIGKAQFRATDLWLLIQQCGAQALPIVSLISILVGLILAFVGSLQLKMFGAQIYVATLVGIGMAREMGALMVAIIMAGRSGAAFAAQIGTMTVREEIDALQTFGISPIDFLVIPRMVALIIMMPLLCIYANFMGIFGGALVAVGTLDISIIQYYNQTVASLNLTHFSIGVFKSVVFGVLIALAGCLRGMQSGRSASAVGDAATSAVVSAIVLIVVSDSLITVILSQLGI